MKKRIIAFLLAIPFLLAGCTAVPETPNSKVDKPAVSAAEHYNDVMSYLLKSKYVFFENFGDSVGFDIAIEKGNDEYNGKLNADFAENRYSLELDARVYAGEEYEVVDIGAVFGDNSAYISADGISELPIKTGISDNGFELDALRALYGIKRLTEAAVSDSIENYYRIIETEDKDSTVALFSVSGEDIKKYTEASAFGEKYGFVAESLELDCDISLKTLPDSEGLKVTDFQVESSLLYTAGGRLCEFALDYEQNAFSAVFKVYADSDNKEISSEYTLKAENGSGVLTLSGEPRDMDTEGYANAPEGFKCHTLEVPFKYNETSNPELNGYNLTIKRVRFKGEAIELQSNTATNDENGEFVFGKDVDLNLSFIHFAGSGGYRISGFSGDIMFEITPQSLLDTAVSLPEQYSEDINTFTQALYEAAPTFCSEIGMSSASSDSEGIIEASDGNGTYIIDMLRGNGAYTTSFTMVTDGIKFADGRVLPLTYESLTEGENGIYTAKLNGRNYTLSSYTDYKGRLCQALECTDEVEGYDVTSSVLYYPELEYGDIKMGFTAKNEDGKYIFTYLDGYTEEKEIVYDETTGEYKII